MIQQIKFQLRKLPGKILAHYGYELRRRHIVTVRTVPEDPHVLQQYLLEKAGIKAPVILDIGANQGQSVTAYRKVFRRSMIHCFEPFPAALEILKKRFKGREGVQIHAFAVSDRSGTQTFHLNRHIQTHSLFPRPQTGRRYYPRVAAPAGKHIKVACTTIDDFIGKEGLNQVDILKLDIQGGEIRALKGARRTLETLCPALIFTEAPFVYHYEGEALFHQLWAYLGEFGYSLYDLFGLNRASNGQLRYANALFVSEDLREQVLDRLNPEP